jgi:hypothetical protein
MFGGDIGLGGFVLIPWLVIGGLTLAVGIPVTIWVVRRLNETWFDPDRGERRLEIRPMDVPDWCRDYPCIDYFSSRLAYDGYWDGEIKGVRTL